MKVKLLAYWNGNEAGQVLDLDPPVAELLVDRGVAVKAKTGPWVVEETPGPKQKVQPREIK